MSEEGQVVSRPSFGAQLQAMVKRNYLIKLRSKGKTFFEVLFPVYMLFILLLMKTSMKPKPEPSVDTPVPVTPDFLSLSPLSDWYISPNNSDVLQIADKIKTIVNKKLRPIKELNFEFFNSEESLEAEFSASNLTFVVGLVFDSLTSNNVSYSIRLPTGSTPDTKTLYGSCRKLDVFGTGCPPLSYVRSGHLLIQSAVDSALMQWKSNTSLSLPEAGLSIYPKESYAGNSKQWLTFAPMYLVWAFMPLVSVLTSTLVLEKEMKIKEGMLMMGLRLSAYWLSWIILQLVIAVALSLVVAILSYVFGILTLNPIILFVFTFLYASSLVMMSILLSPFFKKEKVAGTVASFITLIFGLFHLLNVYLQQYIPFWVNYIIALVSPAAYSLGLEAAVSDEMGFQENTPEIRFTVYSAMLMLVVDCALYLLLAVYLDHVIPGEFGPRYSPWFCFTPSYWSPSKASESSFSLNAQNTAASDGDVEEVSPEIKSKEAIKIEGIRKIYRRDKKDTIAVGGIDLSIYEGQITAILGHNGAGKSTLMNMLVGTLPPSSGTAKLYGYDVSKSSDVPAIRSMLGVCLQQDILVDCLNSVEHLEFFARMKGILAKDAALKVTELLEAVGLTNDKTTICKKLSGGQKRKLCVCIALIGNPRIVLLDEPSSGVDAYSRRQLWALLQSQKENRVLILTTHFMDEADILADRKAIISKGKLRCVGSSMFLKNRFGLGYHLKMDVNQDCDSNIITALVRSKIPGAKVERFTGSEASFMLPLADINKFPSLFELLEDNISSNRGSVVKSYGVSMTSLEEVFLRLGDEEETEDQFPSEEQDQDDQHIVEASSYGTVALSDDYKAAPTFGRSYLAFVKTRLLLSVRNPGQLFSLALLPVIIIIASNFLLKGNEVDTDLKLITLSSDLYGNIGKEMRYWSADGPLPKFEDILRNLTVNPVYMNNTPATLENMRPGLMAINVSNFNAEKGMTWTWIFNDTALHSLPLMQNILTNAYFGLFAQNASRIETKIHPLAASSFSFVFDVKTYTFVIILSVFLSNIPPILAVEVVEDREMKIKDFLRASGLHFWSYWLTVFTIDCLILGTILLGIALIQAFVLKLEFLGDSDALICLILVFVLFVPCSLLFCYNLCHLFDKRDTARSILPTFAYLPAMIMVIFETIFLSLNESVAKTLHSLFCFLWPFYIPQGALMSIVRISTIRSLHLPFSQSYYQLDGPVMICIYALIFHIVLMALLLPVVDILKSGGNVLHFLCIKPLPKVSPKEASLEDDDVRKERSRVENYLRDEVFMKVPIALLSGLRKVYTAWAFPGKKEKKPEKLAVDNLTLMIEPGEIFGLLGPNGAGKTTCIKIMIADERQSEGRVMLMGQEVNSSLSSVYQQIGYCPQHDALWKELTIREHLRCYAAIRGVPQIFIENLCTKMMSQLHISEYADKRVKELSGGTKRKVCFAISLMGQPKLVLLDEPSTGMDPQAKRFLWETILTIFERNKERGVILTTHSMEEADALCNRLGILVKGVLRCLGTIQHLKDKYGAGYMLEVKWDLRAGPIQDIKRVAAQIFGESATIKEEFEDRITFSIPQSSVKSLARVFKALDEAKRSNGGLEEYSFGQTTFEQVFIGFAKQQEE